MEETNLGLSSCYYSSYNIEINGCADCTKTGYTCFAGYNSYTRGCCNYQALVQSAYTFLICITVIPSILYCCCIVGCICCCV